jgi:GntR family transcriptional regulator, transcriptional repressor for pyruvate dehydrogenase complex
MTFEKVKPTRAFQIVVEQIEESILTGKFTQGERLPAERALINDFGISRRTLREALRVLEQKGLIEIKTGSKGGAFVKRIATAQASQMSESLALLIRSKRISLDDLTEFRDDMEGISARRAAERATKEDIQEMKSLLAESQSLLTAKEFDWKAFFDVDRRIHLAVARTARNIVHESILRTVHENIHRYYESYLPQERHVARQSHKGMLELVKAIEEGDSDRAFDCAQDHVRKGNRFMKRPKEVHPV